MFNELGNNLLNNLDKWENAATFPTFFLGFHVPIGIVVLAFYSFDFNHIFLDVVGEGLGKT